MWKNRVMSHFFNIGMRVIQYGCVYHITSEYLVNFVLCAGPSMEPTIQSDDVILVEKVTPLMQRLTCGDIVVVRSPTNPHSHICKRITGLWGDRIKSGLTEIKVPKGHVWLEGDNAKNSTDSRDYGPVPAALIKGRAIYKIYPFGPIPKETPAVSDW